MLWSFLLTWTHLGIGLLIFGALRLWGRKLWHLAIDIAAEVMRCEIERRQKEKEQKI